MWVAVLCGRDGKHGATCNDYWTRCFRNGIYRFICVASLDSDSRLLLGTIPVELKAYVILKSFICHWNSDRLNPFKLGFWILEMWIIRNRDFELKQSYVINWTLDDFDSSAFFQTWMILNPIVFETWIILNPIVFETWIILNPTFLKPWFIWIRFFVKPGSLPIRILNWNLDRVEPGVWFLKFGFLTPRHVFETIFCLNSVSLVLLYQWIRHWTLGFLYM